MGARPGNAEEDIREICEECAGVCICGMVLVDKQNRKEKTRNGA